MIQLIVRFFCVSEEANETAAKQLSKTQICFKKPRKSSTRRALSFRIEQCMLCVVEVLPHVAAHQ